MMFPAVEEITTPTTVEVPPVEVLTSFPGRTKKVEGVPPAEVEAYNPSASVEMMLPVVELFCTNTNVLVPPVDVLIDALPASTTNVDPAACVEAKAAASRCQFLRVRPMELALRSSRESSEYVLVLIDVLCYGRP
jgi:hypothetical protein